MKASFHLGSVFGAVVLLILSRPADGIRVPLRLPWAATVVMCCLYSCFTAVSGAAHTAVQGLDARSLEKTAVRRDADTPRSRPRGSHTACPLQPLAQTTALRRCTNSPSTLSQQRCVECTVTAVVFSMQVRCEVAATMQKLAASSFVFVALHLWMQGVPPLHIALDMAASAAVTLWLFPTAAAVAEVPSLRLSTHPDIVEPRALKMLHRRRR